MIKIGTSGFSFPDWVGAIYPATIKKGELLPYYEQKLGFKIKISAMITVGRRGIKRLYLSSKALRLFFSKRV